MLEVASGAQVKLGALRITGGQTQSGADGVSPGQSGGFGADGGGILNSGALTPERVEVREMSTEVIPRCQENLRRAGYVSSFDGYT